jgi:hypothetical protein
MFVHPNDRAHAFRLLALVLSSIEEERRPSPQWTLNKTSAFSGGRGNFNLAKLAWLHRAYLL